MTIGDSQDTPETAGDSQRLGTARFSPESPGRLCELRTLLGASGSHGDSQDTPQSPPSAGASRPAVRRARPKSPGTLRELRTLLGHSGSHEDSQDTFPN